MKENYPMKSPKVRRALRLGVDYDLIAKALFPPGMSREAPFPGARMGATTRDVSMKLDFWRSWSEDIRRFDIKEARELIAEAGYPGGKGFLNPDGSSVKLFTMLRARSPFGPDLMQAIIAEWRKNLGIDVQMVPIEYGIFKKEWSKGEHREGRTRGQMCFFASNIQDTPENALRLYYVGRPHMGPNLTAELIPLYQKISQTLNAEKRFEIVEKAWGMIRAGERHAHILENSSVFGTSGIKDCRLAEGWDHMEVTYSECRPIP